MTAPHIADLGATEDPRALVPGDPGLVEHQGELLARDSRTMESVATALRRIDAPHWSGAAATAFRSTFETQPTKWFALAEVMTRAAAALSAYASTLRSSQSLAAEAIALWNQGETETARARREYDVQQNQTFIGPPGSTPPVPDHCFVDPGEPLRQAARDTLARARNQLDCAGLEAATSLARLAGLRPPPPKGSPSGWRTSGDWLGAEGEANGPEFSLDRGDREYGRAPWNADHQGRGHQRDPSFVMSLGDISGSAWLWKGAASWERSYGDLDLAATSDAFLGVEGKAGLTVDDDGLEAGAEALLGAKGSAEAEATYDIAAGSAHGEAMAGAHAKGDASVGLGGAHAGGELFAGGKIAGEVKGDVAGFGGELTAEGWAGAGVGGDAELSWHDGKLVVGGTGGLAWGVGGLLGGKITIDVPKVIETAEEAADAVGDWID